MADDEPDDVFGWRGSVFGPFGELRFTRRCLVEDLGLAPDAPAQAVLELPVAEALRACPVAEAGDDGLAHAAGLVVAPGEERSPGWVLACGDDASSRVEELEAADMLWPDHRDFERVGEDGLARAIDRLRVAAPLALQAARAEPGRTVPFAGGLPNQILVEVGREDSATYLALEVPGDGGLAADAARRLTAITLASVHGDAAWEPVDALPSGQGVGSLVFRHASAG